ncbi:PAS domain-containing protein [Streptomyces sp. PT12]|uniref:PAS domain-containing protein n=1 Tax=Streptomyces sp. PT12 TaxID=1510197 RepID=UPI000DE5320E|nr:PAS domain-containing protein [Streptomyces sp. PT12]RBM16140.1 diguanylate cyclase [Streptomyces sp. PT12]
MAEADDFGAELTDFRNRVAELRATRALPGGTRTANLDAALFELQYVSDVLWPRYEQLAASARRAAGPADQREQQLLRAVFQRLPLPVLLLDRDGVVSRLNFAASQLFGLRAGYAAGRSITASLAHEGRAAFRGQVAAVARHEGSRGLSVELMRGIAGGDRGPARLWVTLTAVRPPGHRRTSVLAVCQPAGGPGHVGSADEPEARPDPGPDPGEVSSHVALMDLLDDMAATLLDEGNAPDSPLLRAARLLHGRFADWVIADRAAPGGGPLRRVAVLAPDEGPGAEHAAAIAARDPADAPLIGEAARAGGQGLRVRPEDPYALGEAEDGVPLLALTEASSLLCVPLTLPSGAVLGVLTLLRVGGRPAFELAEASAAERMSRHVALALRAS